MQSPLGEELPHPPRRVFGSFECGGLINFGAPSGLSNFNQRKQFDIVSAQNKELWALAQKAAAEAAEPIKTGMSKAFSNAG